MDEVTEMPSNSGDQVDSCCSDERCCGSQSPVVRSAPKVERNEPCPCDSGRKFKKCCGKTI